MSSLKKKKHAVFFRDSDFTLENWFYIAAWNIGVLLYYPLVFYKCRNLHMLQPMLYIWKPFFIYSKNIYCKNISNPATNQKTSLKFKFLASVNILLIPWPVQIYYFARNSKQNIKTMQITDLWY